MNHGTVTGGVVKEAVSAYTPPSFDAPCIRRVLFTIATQDSHKVRAFWNCEAEGTDEFLDMLLANCHPGRGIKLDYELATRPFMQHGVHKGEIRFLRVIKAEFPVRAAVPEPEPAGVES